MLRKNILCLLAAVWMLTGCASSRKPSMQQTDVPPLDAALAAPCQEILPPDSADIDAYLDWSIDLLGKYGDCARRHQAVVQAWPGNVKN